MSPHVGPLLLLLFFCMFGASHSCLEDRASAYRFTGAVCRLTYPAAVVLNEKTTKVIEAAFQHARYPNMKGEKSLAFIGKLTYGLENLEIHNLTIGRSSFALRAGVGIDMEISNVSAFFKGTLQYGYGSWLIDVENSLDFEVESQIDLGINPKLYCGHGKVAADTSDCYLNFHKLRLHLQGDREPNWLKKLFTDIITFTVKLLVKSQICKEINKLANILADFIQDTAEQFLGDGDISMDIGVTAAPVITANYVESYHKGLTQYQNSSALITDSVFHPSQLTEDRMLYFWLSDHVFNPMVAAAHEDGRFQLNISAAELRELFNTSLSSRTPGVIREAHTSTDVRASYSDKKLFLHGIPTEIFVTGADLPSTNNTINKEEVEFIREAVEKIGIPKVLSVLEQEVTRLLDKQGANLFDIINPEVIPRDGFVLIQMDFGFPHHLLVQFLKRTLQ